MDDRERELASLVRSHLFDLTSELAAAFLDSLPDRKVAASVGSGELASALGGELPEGPREAVEVVRELAEAVERGLVATPGPRYFGFVTGGALPAALAADWLTSAWDQNAALHAMSPAAAVAERAVERWLLELLGLPATASIGLVTGCQMANFTGLAAGRHAVLAAAGWDVGEGGLREAPPLAAFVGEEAHVTVLAALGMLGLGAANVITVPADDQGRMRSEALAECLATWEGPALVACQAGNVNTGAFDPLDEIVEIAHGQGAWVHVDGAFGLWAAASPRHEHRVRGVAGADSWASDAHKWLNVPYDCGIAAVASRRAHRAALAHTAAYLIPAEGEDRDPMDFTPEASRRARVFPVWAALRSLGRRGVAELVDRCCELAGRFAERLGAEPGVEIGNDVVLNQVLVRFLGDDPGASDELTRAVLRRVQEGGVCWMGGTEWKGRAWMRISVSNHSTRAEDVDRSADAVLAAYAALAADR